MRPELKSKTEIFQLQFSRVSSLRFSKKVDSTSLANMISENSGSFLQLISRMTLVDNRIDLKSARSIFNVLQKSLKIKLSADIMNTIDGIIMNNMTSTMDQYTYDLSAER